MRAATGNTRGGPCPSGAAGGGAVGAAGRGLPTGGGHGVVGSVRHREGGGMLLGGDRGGAKAHFPANSCGENGFAMPQLVGCVVLGSFL